jgi:hypothetical protein
MLFGNLKITMPPPPPDLPIAASVFLLENNIQKKNFAKNHSMGPRVIFHWTSEAKKYNVPCHHTALILRDKLMICKENPAKIPVW